MTSIIVSIWSNGITIFASSSSSSFSFLLITLIQNGLKKKIDCFVFIFFCISKPKLKAESVKFNSDSLMIQDCLDRDGQHDLRMMIKKR
jgi:hypothetical protein